MFVLVLSIGNIDEIRFISQLRGICEIRLLWSYAKKNQFFWEKSGKPLDTLYWFMYRI